MCRVDGEDKGGRRDSDRNDNKRGDDEQEEDNEEDDREISRWEFSSAVAKPGGTDSCEELVDSDSDTMPLADANNMFMPLRHSMTTTAGNDPY